VTVFGETHPLPDPFLVLATQNPIELEGTYPLPEAQLDRFLFKLVVEPPSPSELKQILKRTTTDETQTITPVLEPASALETIADMRLLVRQVLLAPPLEDYIVSLVSAASPNGSSRVPSVKTYVRFGPGPRAAQAVVLGAKVSALLDGRGHASFADVSDMILPAMRHRLILNFQAEAEDVTAEQILADVTRTLPRP
jgi:MoxR-like ATPase